MDGIFVKLRLFRQNSTCPHVQNHKIVTRGCMYCRHEEVIMDEAH